MHESLLATGHKNDVGILSTGGKTGLMDADVCKKLRMMNFLTIEQSLLTISAPVVDKPGESRLT